MKKIGIFGGTFDPPHIGHFIIAEEVRYHCQLDEIWFLPAYLPPHKQRDDLTPAKQRIEMLELGINDRTKFSICTLEIERKGTSYTFDTMKELVEKFPNVKFYFIIGGDLVEHLHEWYRIDELLKLVTFVGTKRPRYRFLPQVNNEKIIFVDVPQLDISSSMIRERVKERRSIDYFVPEKIKEYIKEHQLYATR